MKNTITYNQLAKRLAKELNKLARAEEKKRKEQQKQQQKD